VTPTRTRRALTRAALLAACVAWLAPAPAARATDVADVTIATPVTDIANVLSPADEERVAARLVAYREATGVQLAVVLVDSTGAVPSDDWANALFRRWGGGTKERNDGALFVLAISDRANRLELGYGLEGHISDAMALDMLVDLRPLLREGRYADASLQLIDAVWAATADIAPVAPIGLPLARSPWFFLGMMIVALAGGAAWLVRLVKAPGGAAHAAARGKQHKKTGFAAGVPDIVPVADAVAHKRAKRLRTLLEVVSIFVIAPALVAVLAHPGMRAPFPWFLAWESWALLGVLGAGIWLAMPIARWIWLIPSAAGVGFIVYCLFGGLSVPAMHVALSAGGVIGGPEDVYTYGLGALGAIGFWGLMVTSAASPGSGGSSASSYRSSSSSSSSSHSSASSSSRSSWSGGGGSSGGGGASSSW